LNIKFQGTINLFNHVLSIDNTTDSLNDTIFICQFI